MTIGDHSNSCRSDPAHFLGSQYQAWAAFQTRGV